MATATNENELKKQREINIKKMNKQSKGISSGLVIGLSFLVALAIFILVFGNPSNFIGGDRNNLPLQGNMLGIIYKGGFVIPIIMTMLISVLVLSVERYFAVNRSKGKGDLTSFVANIKAKLENDDIQGARDLCATQKGSVAAVISSGLDMYELMQKDNSGLTKEQKASNISQKMDEALALELPMMNQNLPVIATFSNLGTLVGLFGTVLGMIRSFSALGGSGGTDSAALSVGISEALVNTAFGILTGACAIIAYNYYTSKIDTITYAIDEIGFSIVNVFQSRH